MPKSSKQIFLFKVIAINFNTLVGAIFQLMHCSQKISNRNSLQFCSYRSLFECRLWLHIVTPSTPFLTSEMQNSQVDSNQESMGMVKSFA